MSIQLNGKIYRELRCPHCRKLICYEYVHTGRVAFQCPRCGKFSNFNFKSMEAKEDKVDLKATFNIKSKNREGVIIDE